MNTLPNSNDRTILQQENPNHLSPQHDDAKLIFNRGSRTLRCAVTIWLNDNTRAKWEILKTKRIRVAEHIRRVIEPELDRLLALEEELQKENSAS